MIRGLPLVLVLVALVLGAWLLLRSTDDEPAPLAPAGQAAAPTASGEPQAANAADAVAGPAPAEAAPLRSEAVGNPDQPPIPADAKWIEVLVVDASTKQPVPDAEVLWCDNLLYQKLEALPAKERQPFYVDPEAFVRRFGWRTKSDARGLARVTDRNGATVHAYSDGRYGTSYFGGEQVAPADGWKLRLEEDAALRVQVVDSRGQPAMEVPVAIRMTGSDGKPLHGWVQSKLTGAPDGVAEFRHVQTWLRVNGGKAMVAVASWRAVIDVPGLADSGAEFDRDAPPSEPLVLQLPATGRLAVRLLHAGLPLTKDVSISVVRSDVGDSSPGYGAAGAPVGDDGWARFARVALGGSLKVVAQCGSGVVETTTPGPLGQDQELRIELTTDGLLALAGRLLGPDGSVLANSSAMGNVDLEFLMGGLPIKTDAQGRFLYLLPKGHKDTAALKRLVLTMPSKEGTSLRAAVAPRDLVRGVNQLGDIQLTHGALVVAGRFVTDPPDAKMRVDFRVEACAASRDRDGKERWERVEGLTPVYNADGTFEVRGDVGPVQHRLAFPASNHLPVEPVEFRTGADDLSIAVSAGCSLSASCLPHEELPVDRLSGVLRPVGEVAPKPDRERGDLFGPRRDRFTARAWGGSAETADLRWSAVPAGTYTLELRTDGFPTPLATIADVVLPPPSGGDPRLRGIDLRGKVATLTVRVTGIAQDERSLRESAVVFPMPQNDPLEWKGMRVVAGELVMPVLPGPIELLVASCGSRPTRVVTSEREVTVALEPWPTVELTFAGLPPLPQGTTLRVAARDANQGQAQQRRRYSAGDHGSGQLDSLLQPDSGAVEVKDGRATVQVGDGAFRLGAYLIAEGNRRPQSLRTIVPKEIQGGSDLPPIGVQLSADEVKAALEALQKAPAGK